MRISIWQQFSSNHSGFFWVAGTFKNVKDAESAFEELRGILHRVGKWHRDNPEASQKAQLSSIEPVLPERKVADEYGVEWQQTIDWTNWPQYAQQLIDDAVTIVGNVVTISNPDQTWMSIQPFAGLLEKIGADPVIGFDLELIESGVDYETAGFQVSFISPEEVTAGKLYDSLKTYLDDTQPVSMKPLPPWDDYTANFKKALDAGSILRQGQIDILVKKENWRREHTVEPFRAKRRRELLAVPGGIIRREGTSLTMRLGHVSELALAAIIAYLEVQNCRDIDCRYVRSEELSQE